MEGLRYQPAIFKLRSFDKNVDGKGVMEPKASFAP
jgi:hypothetical protein